MPGAPSSFLLLVRLLFRCLQPGFRSCCDAEITAALSVLSMVNKRLGMAAVNLFNGIGLCTLRRGQGKNADTRSTGSCPTQHEVI